MGTPMILDDSRDLAGPGTGQSGQLRGRSGILPRQDIRTLVRRRMVRSISGDVIDSQYQPASLDLRLGSRAYRVRASFLPGPSRTVDEALDTLVHETLNLDDGAVLERGCVYVVELMESLHGLPDTISAFANPKSSTGRLDVFTRLIADRSDVFDTVRGGGYSGKLYLEISPSSFSIKVRKGSRLNQLRFRRRNSSQEEAGDFRLMDKDLRDQHERAALVDGTPVIRNGLVLHIDLAGMEPGGIVGYRAQKFTDVVDVDNVGGYRIADFWEPILTRGPKRIILDPHQFYILASKEKLHIPSTMAAEMAPIDPAMGEFRVHYAGFFDPGFGVGANGAPGSRGVLEVRSHEVPFILEDGQVIGRLAFERMVAEPDALYGQIGTSNYQGQALKLSKHFVA